MAIQILSQSHIPACSVGHRKHFLPYICDARPYFTARRCRGENDTLSCFNLPLRCLMTLNDYQFSLSRENCPDSFNPSLQAILSGLLLGPIFTPWLTVSLDTSLVLAVTNGHAGRDLASATQGKSTSLVVLRKILFLLYYWYGVCFN